MNGENTKLEPVPPRAFTRYLGVDVRPRSFGYVVIEDGAALDCGIRVCDRTQFDDCLGERFSRILRIYAPSAVIVLATGSNAAKEKRQIISRAIKKRAKRNNVAVTCIRAAALRRYFRQCRASTKHEIAQAVAQILPELAWRLPPKRKPWQSEAHRMSIFDAAAAVIAYVSL